MSTYTIEQTRQLSQERYENNLRFEEMTDIAERIGYPIDTTIHYELRGDALYAASDTVERPFHNQTWLALQRGKELFQGDQAFEKERLRLEHEEALLVDSFGRGELEGNLLIKFSKVPDAVVRGETSISGYRRDLLRSFVRVYWRTDAGVDCRLFTLDGNNALATERVGELLGIDTSRQSEQILGDVSLVQTPGSPKVFVGELVDRAKLVYDQAVYQATGQRTHAGSRYIGMQDAMKEISGQHRLVDQHMRAITEIMKSARGGTDMEPILENERRRTAAAIKLSTEGVAVTSSGDSSVDIEVTTRDYGRECATAMGMNQAQNMENVWTFGECQVCFAQTSVGSCKVCARCAREDDRGVDLLKLREQYSKQRKTKRPLARAALQPLVQPIARASRNLSLADRYGEQARVRVRIVTGDALREVYHVRTGEVLGVL